MSSRDFESVVRMFAGLYESEEPSRIVADFAGMETGKIAFDQSALSNWYSIWRAAIRQYRELDLVRAALRDTPRNEELLALERRLGNGSLTLRSLETSEAPDRWDRQRLVAIAIAPLLVAATVALLLSGSYPLAIGTGAGVLAAASAAL